MVHIHKKQSHFDKLFKTVDVSTSMSPKKVPCHDSMSEEPLEPGKASRYTSAIGVLIYLACDMPECAHTIRGLSKKMSQPTDLSWLMLRHLCLYLLEGRKSCFQLEIKPDGLWHSGSTDLTASSWRCLVTQIGQETSKIVSQSVEVLFASEDAF